MLLRLLVNKSPMNKPQEPASCTDARLDTGSFEAPSISSEQLFGNSRQLQILHQGEVYTLRITHRGKLILTK